MKCLVALRRWEIAGNPWRPDLTLTEVVNAAGMAKVPVDPFRPDGGPLTLRIASGEPLIESVSPEPRDKGDKPRTKLTYRIGKADDRR